jgi:thioredoxin-like negative regulator of GroEL
MQRSSDSGKVVAGYDGKVKLAKVDTDAQMQLAAVFGITVCRLLYW